MRRSYTPSGLPRPSRGAAGVGADRCMDSWLHRHLSLAAAETDVPTLDALPVLWRRPAAGAGAAGFLPKRPDHAESGPRPRLANRPPESMAGRHAAGESPAGALARQQPVGGCGCPGRYAAGPSGAPMAGETRRRIPGDLPERTRGARASRLHGAGREPECHTPASAAAAAVAPPAAFGC